MSRFRNNNRNGCAPPPAAPTATCHDRAALAVAAPGREYQGSLDFGRAVEYRVVTGSRELLVPDTAVAGPVVRFQAMQDELVGSDPFSLPPVCEVEVPAGYQGSRCRVTASVSNPLLGALIRFALYSGKRRILGPWSAHVNQPLDVPLQHREAVGGREFALRVAIAPAGLSSGATPIRSQVVAFGTLELWALGDWPHGLPCSPCEPKGGAC